MHRHSIPISHRTYYSYEHHATPPFAPAETAILSAAFSHVPSLGFTTEALTQGARDAGYLDASVNLFPSGAFALVNYHLVTRRLALAESESSPSHQSRSTAEEVKRLILKRLHANASIIHRWQEVCQPILRHLAFMNSRYLSAFRLTGSALCRQALALLALPMHIPTSFRELALLADETLFLAGDTSVDTSWYLKRAALSAIYASSELFMTQDTSLGFVETEQFLSRRLEEAQRTRSSMEMAGKWMGMQGIGLVNILRSKGVRI